MADYFCQFSCMFDVGTAENAVRAIEIQRQHAVALFDEEGSALGFDVQHDPESGAGALWISSDEYGEPEHVIAFVLACTESFKLTVRWGFVWALTCSRPRLDGFGGGAQAIDLGARKSLGWIDCDHWLKRALDPASCNRRRSAANRSWAPARIRTRISPVATDLTRSRSSTPTATWGSPSGPPRSLLRGPPWQRRASFRFGGGDAEHGIRAGTPSRR